MAPRPKAWGWFHVERFGSGVDNHQLSAYPLAMVHIPRTQPLQRALTACGGPAALARRLGLTPQAVCKWHQVPAERVLAVEAACRHTVDPVSRHELRPDLYPVEPAPSAGETRAAA